MNQQQTNFSEIKNYSNAAKIALILIFALIIILLANKPASAASSLLYFPPVADSFVLSTSPNSNRGDNEYLNTTNGSQERIAFMRFDIDGLDEYNAEIINATLWVYIASNQQTSGFDIRSVADNSWDEMTITYSNAPTMNSVFGSSGQVNPGTWVGVDISSYITGEGEFSLALTTEYTEYTSYGSFESGETSPVIILHVNGDLFPQPSECTTICGPIPD